MSLILCDRCGHNVSRATDDGVLNDDLRSWRSLSSSEAVSLADDLRARTSLLTQLEGELERVRRVLLQLEETKRATEAAVSKQRAMLSPIRRLPPEVLIEIFDFACDDEDVGQLRCSAPTLSVVCRYWRGRHHFLSVIVYTSNAAQLLCLARRNYGPASTSLSTKWTTGLPMRNYSCYKIISTYPALTLSTPRWRTTSLRL